MDDTTIHCVLTFLIIVGAINAEMIVMNDIAIDTYPAYDEGTPKSVCIVGQPEPRSESGRPRLINARYITARRSEPISDYPHLLEQLSLHETEVKYIEPVVLAEISSLPVFQFRIRNGKKPFLKQDNIGNIKLSV